MSKILRVWGKADNIDLILNIGTDGRWRMSIPPDLTDGQYLTILYALGENGKIGVWTGTLYITNGVCRLELKKERTDLLLIPETPYESEFL